MPEVDARGERLLLIERSRSLSMHAGQLAFPGGKQEPHDRDLLDTALRESEEEVGLCREEVRVLGRLEPVPTPTGFVIVPFVARLLSAWVPSPTSPEVAAIVLPGLGELCDPGIHRVTDTRRWRGRDYHLHEFKIYDPPLWGATARMTYDLLERASLVGAI
jgi:8-oxo-dGTP pyrophosphatase MutT (NUDIX family)